MTVGPEHMLVVKRLERLVARVEGSGCHMFCQGPVTLGSAHEPEPDGVIVVGKAEAYAERHPGPGEVLVVFEAAASSLAADRTTKQRIYADAGVPQYVVINIPEACVEFFEEPLRGQGSYGRVTVLKAGGVLRLELGAGERLDIPAANLLP
jgi:hypothetical protein